MIPILFLDVGWKSISNDGSFATGVLTNKIARAHMPALVGRPAEFLPKIVDEVVTSETKVLPGLDQLPVLFTVHHECHTSFFRFRRINISLGQVSPRVVVPSSRDNILP